MNCHRLGPRFRRRLQQNRAESAELMTQFMHLAEIIDGFGGSWSYEWPAFCLGWKLDPLKQWFGGRPSFHARFDGCRFGLTDRRGRPVKKPWVVMTSNRTLAAGLDGFLCQCPRGAHAPCEGSVARSSENYTEVLAQAAIHAIALHYRPECNESDGTYVAPPFPSFNKGCNASCIDSGEKALGSLPPRATAPHAFGGTLFECSSNSSNAVDSCECPESHAEKSNATNRMGGQPSAAKGLTALHMQDAGHVDLSFASSDGLAGDDETSHRCADNCGCSGALGMVTRIISPREPEFHSKRGKAAIDTEVSDLRAECVWDEGSVKEWADVRYERKDGYTPMVGLLFLIMGQKHSELDSGLDVEDPNCPFRARAVFQGSNVRTGDGTPAWMLYQEVGRRVHCLGGKNIGPGTMF